MKKRLSNLQKSIPKGINAVLVTSPINRRYYTGFLSSAGTMLVTRSNCYLIVDSRYFEAADNMLPDAITVLLKEEGLEQQLRKLLKKHRAKKVAIENKTTTVRQLQGYQKAFDDVTLVTDHQLTSLIEAQRAIKSEEELQSMRAAQAVADKAFLRLLNYIETGRTEREIANDLERFCKEYGAESLSFSTILASGKHSAIPHASPSDKEIQTGDFVTIDFGCMVNGYVSDMTRTVAMGAVSPEQNECYETVLAAQMATIAAIKGGISCVEVDKVARKIIDASEFKGHFTHGVGHCLGLEVHEPPHCNQRSKDTLEPGMVTSVEPGIYLPNRFGVRIEDTVHVTKNGCENLCTSPKELIIL